jgi:hypothetical protein
VDIHPAAKALPEMQADELNELAASIKQNGLLVPIELFKGKVIDGRHRLKACKIAGVEPEFVDIDLQGQTPGEYVWAPERRASSPDTKSKGGGRSGVASAL